MGVEPSRIHLIPNGADRERFSRPVREFSLRRRFGIPTNRTIVLSVGRENPAKAYDVGLRAFALAVSDRHVVCDVILGRNTARWRSLTEELGVRERVIFCEALHCDELVGAYQQADLFFMP